MRLINIQCYSKLSYPVISFHGTSQYQKLICINVKFYIVIALAAIGLTTLMELQFHCLAYVRSL